MLSLEQRREILRSSLTEEAAAVEDARLAYDAEFDAAGTVARIHRAFHRMRTDAESAEVPDITELVRGLELALEAHRENGFEVDWALVDQAARTLIETSEAGAIGETANVDAQLVARARSLGQKASGSMRPDGLRPA